MAKYYRMFTTVSICGANFLVVVSTQCHLVHATAGAGSFKSNFDMLAFFDGN
jgi:hypothetical protein